MNTKDQAVPATAYSAEVEFDLQEAIAQRKRAAELFGPSDWHDEAEEIDEIDETEDPDDGD